MKRNFTRVMLLLFVAALLITSVPIQSMALSYNGSASYRTGKYYSALTRVNLTGNQRTDIVNVAKSQVGYQEGSSSSQLAGTVFGGGNYTEYGRWYGMQDMWCAMFVSWCANVAGVPNSVVPYHAYTPSGLSWFQSRGRAYSRATVAAGGYTPQPGDIIYFKSPRNSNPTNHVGIVTSYSGGVVNTVEGNTSSATVSTNGGAVASKSYSISNTYIVYICKPAYTGASSSSGSSSSSSSSSTTVNSIIPSNLKSVVFDAKYYSAKNPDIKAAFGTDETKLYKHFNDFGIKEGRQGSANFSIKYYVENNSDLKKAYGTDYVSAIKHFINFGYKENRMTAPALDLGNVFDARINVAYCGLDVGISGTNVLTVSEKLDASQVWTFIRNNDGSYKIKNKATGKCLDVSGASTSSGANIQIYADNGTKAQSWFIHENYDGTYIIRSKCASTCVMDVSGGSSTAGTNIMNYTADGTQAQKFTISKISGSQVVALNNSYVDLGSGFTAKITGIAAALNVSVSGTSAVLASDAADANQAWVFTRQSDGSYEIKNVATGKCLDVANGKATSTSVGIHADNDSAAQRWFIYWDGLGYNLFPSCSATTALDIKGGSKSVGAAVQTYTRNGTSAQRFIISKVNSASDLVPAALIPESKIALVFDADYYLYANPDLKSFAGHPGKLYRHFLEFGVKEGRKSSPIFDIACYLNNNSDLLKAYGEKNYFSALRHFMSFGYKEIRVTALSDSSLAESFDAKINLSYCDLNLGLSGTNVTAVSKTGDNSQIWTFTRNSDGSYTITNKSTGKVLDVQGGYAKSDVNVQVYAPNSSDAQKWYIQKTENGNYVIHSKCSGACVLTVVGSGTANGTDIQNMTYTGSKAQEFSIVNI